MNRCLKNWLVQQQKIDKLNEHLYNFFLSLRLQYLPFATDTNPASELAKFYRDCASAPPLMQDTLNTNSSSTTTSQHSADAVAAASAAFAADDELNMADSGSLDDLTRQLEHFETSLDDYDSLVKSLCCPQSDEVDSNSNS